ncbi:MAG: chromosomal replication initiator protein DnaA [Christensenellales bacterium]
MEEKKLTQLNYTEIWDNAKKLIVNKTSALTFDVWIKALEPIGVRGDALILMSKSEGAKSVILKSYSDIITSSIKECTSELSSFELVVEDDEDAKEIISQNEKINDELNKKEFLKPKEKYSNNASFNPKFTFDNYVVGPSNEFTVAASKAVAENPGTNYNPLFIYGGVGLGKTHILHAIGNYLLDTKPELNVVYVTTEQFVNEFIETVGKNELDLNTGFRNKYRSADVLMVDDIQSIIGKPRVQEEFFHTFNALTSANKQIILSSDRPPKEINPLEERLRSRFECGLITDIGVPEIETRIAILKKKVIIERHLVDDEVLEYIAEAMTTNVRELEGFLSRCVFYAGLLKKPRVTLDVAKEALKNYITVSKVTFDSDKIVEKVCKYFEISKNQLLGKDRKKELSYARQICMYLLDEMLEMPYTSIGKIFNKDHATVIYCKNKVAKQIKTDKLMQTQVKDIKDLCTSKGI